MYVFKLKDILITFSIIVITLISVFGFVGDYNKLETSANVYKNRIVIDAGHGLPDGGATANGLVEADLNLEIARKLENELIALGYDVVMTREDENSIADVDEHASIAKIKQSDLTNRVKAINESNADLGVSIHMNKYSVAKYWGWQTFYSESSEAGRRLAVAIQDGISEMIEKNNSRQALKISNIKIIDKTSLPVVIVECGFLSNPEEAVCLQTEEYQDKLVQGICNGIKGFYQSTN